MSSPDKPTIPFAPILEVPGANLHLRLASPNDAEELAAAYRLAGDAVTHFVPQAPQLTTAEAAARHLDIVKSDMEAGSAMQYHIARGRPEDGKPLLGIVKWRDHTPDNAIAMIGAWALPHYWGQGLVRQAAERVINYAAQEDVWGLKTAFAKEFLGHTRSEGILLRLGFRPFTSPYEDKEFREHTGESQMVRLWTRQL